MNDFAPDTADCATGHVTAIATVIVQSLPEPTAAVLAGLALPAASLFLVRRGRRIGRRLRPPAAGTPKLQSS